MNAQDHLHRITVNRTDSETAILTTGEKWRIDHINAIYADVINQDYISRITITALNPGKWLLKGSASSSDSIDSKSVPWFSGTYEFSKDQLDKYLTELIDYERCQGLCISGKGAPKSPKPVASDVSWLSAECENDQDGYYTPPLEGAL